MGQQSITPGLGAKQRGTEHKASFSLLGDAYSHEWTHHLEQHFLFVSALLGLFFAFFTIRSEYLDIEA